MPSHSSSMEISAADSLRIHISSFPPHITMSAPSSHPTIYFGYGSNLWRRQMRLRCPTSKYLGIARLKGYRWIIYDRGYANIVQIPDDDDNDDGDEHKSNNNLIPATKHDYTNEVWGLVYSLETADERRLDGSEGVPIAYQKEWIRCDFWAAKDEDEDEGKDRNENEIDDRRKDEPLPKKIKEEEKKKVDMLVYINRAQTQPSEPKEEYIYRMNMGIKDAVREGVPERYVEQVMRKFIPDVEDDRVAEVAGKQALEFEDER